MDVKKRILHFEFNLLNQLQYKKRFTNRCIQKRKIVCHKKLHRNGLNKTANHP